MVENVEKQYSCINEDGNLTGRLCVNCYNKIGSHWLFNIKERLKRDMCSAKLIFKKY